jgi:Domain of unknown function (DUF4160)
MPVIVRVQGLKFYFFSNEGPRPHIHVGLDGAKGGPEIKIWIDTVEVAKVRGFSQKLVQKAEKFVLENKGFFLEEWENYFGK